MVCGMQVVRCDQVDGANSTQGRTLLFTAILRGRGGGYSRSDPSLSDQIVRAPVGYSLLELRRAGRAPLGQTGQDANADGDGDQLGGRLTLLPGS